MLNQIVLVGRIAGETELKETESGKKVSTITLAVPRSFKNSEGVYDTDFIRCVLWNVVAEKTIEYCKKGDIVGLKGRLQVSSYTNKKNETKYTTDVIAEKITFLSSRSKEINENLKQEETQKEENKKETKKSKEL